MTALPFDVVAGILDERQRYQAASANLLALGDEVRFTHQLLQEYFVARAMRERIFPGSAGVSPAVGETPSLLARDIWQPKNWWEPTNWEEATILLAGLYSDDCTDVLMWLAETQPELAARCIVESGAHTPDETKLRLREMWLPRLTDLKRDPDARARAAVGRALGRIALEDGTPLDNRPGVGFVLRNGLKIPDIAWGEEVPAGKYTIGGDKKAFRNFDKRPVTISYPYRLARYPVTNAQFACFVAAPDFGDGRWWRGLPDKERQIDNPYFPYANGPRERVSWYQAVAFCRWLSDKLGYTVELPHEYEWEVAARWPDNRLYPWGNEFDAAKANTVEGDRVGEPTVVGLYPHGANSKLNLYDLSGNVWEWCRNKYETPDDEGIDDSDAWRVLRGGSFINLADNARAAYRNYNVPGNRSDYSGFRLVVVRRSPSHHEH
ncbi:MAG: SUMF1/EgtB/PvdO family nonheme iron enzyme [Chloroflexi bacterium]|nr:SUMF1/EgtB/PvdO family nonheme iron enzyme [Chloroflexota bacterium]